MKKSFLLLLIIVFSLFGCKIKNDSEDNQSLAMKINEMVSLDKIREVSTEQGLTYNNKNIKSVLE